MDEGMYHIIFPTKLTPNKTIGNQKGNTDKNEINNWEPM